MYLVNDRLYVITESFSVALPIFWKIRQNLLRRNYHRNIFSGFSLERRPRISFEHPCLFPDWTSRSGSNFKSRIRVPDPRWRQLLLGHLLQKGFPGRKIQNRFWLWRTSAKLTSGSVHFQSNLLIPTFDEEKSWRDGPRAFVTTGKRH